MMNKRVVLFIWAVLSLTTAYAGDSLRYTLRDCRKMALDNSASARADEASSLAAKYNRQAALAAMFPKVSANGAYMWNSRNAHLLGDQTELRMGTASVAGDGTASFDWNGTDALSGLINATAGTPFQTPLQNLQNQAGQTIANTYKRLYDALTIDLEHILVARVGVTQPIWVGGRLIQMYKISKSAEKIASFRSSTKHDETISKVDEAYWRVVSVEHKKALANQYYDLLVQLENDVTEAVNEGMATQSDLLKVKAKRGEAEVKKLQAENGLTLSRMALAQVCGLPLMEPFSVDDSELNTSTLAISGFDASSYVDGRSELQMLQETEKIAQSSVKLAAAGLQPNIVASANYNWTNPNADNGLSSGWDSKGFFSVGVVVNVPIAHADDILRYKAAKEAAKVASLKTEEARELLTLQTTQANQKLMEAQQKVVLARLNQTNAEEVLRMARESYDAGMITASDLMMAQTAWMSAASDLIDAQTEAKNTETALRRYMNEL
jgi:outer membrane protein TolC